MIITVIGACNSGKSLYAEGRLVSLSQADASKLSAYNASKLSAYNASKICAYNAQIEKRIYLATMIPYGKEGEERVKKHRSMRSDKGFETFEWQGIDDTQRLLSSLDENTNVLLEDVSNLVADFMFADDALEKSCENVVRECCDFICKIKEKVKNLVIVSNDFSGEDVNRDAATLMYLKAIEDINKFLIDISDESVEIVSGKERCIK